MNFTGAKSRSGQIANNWRQINDSAPLQLPDRLSDLSAVLGIDGDKVGPGQLSTLIATSHPERDLL